jgi:hypothetical protein
MQTLMREARLDKYCAKCQWHLTESRTEQSRTEQSGWLVQYNRRSCHRSQTFRAQQTYKKKVQGKTKLISKIKNSRCGHRTSSVYGQGRTNVSHFSELRFYFKIKSIHGLLCVKLI